MKKLVTIFFFICLAINTIQAFNRNNCVKEMKFTDLNSKNVLNYLKENNLADKIIQICSEDMCNEVNISRLEQDIKSFIKQNIKYLQSKDSESSIEAELKGFRIDKILINGCL